MGVEDEELEDRLTNERYKVWKKNVPYLYEIMISHLLEWPSLTVQWLPDKTAVQGRGLTEGRVVLGTHAPEPEQNYLMIAKVAIPGDEEDVDTRKYDQDTDEAGGYGHRKGKIEIVCRMMHEGEVNRARYMPQNPSVIATKGPSPDVLVFDYTKHASQPAAGSACKPELRLTGHSKEGYGLSWNALEEGRLLSGSDDSLILVWDVKAPCADKTKVAAVGEFKGHTGPVTDVAWNMHSKSVFASVGEDRMLLLWDQKAGSSPTNKPVVSHDKEINCLAFSPHRENLILTGSADKMVKLWDTRDLSKPLHTFVKHQDTVTQVQWSPTREEVLASSGLDRMVHVWDLSRIEEVASTDREMTEEGPPELLFIHAGHTKGVSDFSWDPNARANGSSAVASVSE
ncbi:structural basis of the interaction of Rbap46RBAP48 WITH histone H4, partial [Baffinella frigidus]